MMMYSVPAPIIEDGFESDFEVIDGDVWEKPKGGEIYSPYIRGRI